MKTLLPSDAAAGDRRGAGRAAFRGREDAPPGGEAALRPLPGLARADAPGRRAREDGGAGNPDRAGAGGAGDGAGIDTP